MCEGPWRQRRGQRPGGSAGVALGWGGAFPAGLRGEGDTAVSPAGPGPGPPLKLRAVVQGHLRTSGASKGS